MDVVHSQRHVAQLFPSRGRRSTLVAVEHELISVDCVTGSAVAPDRIRKATRHGRYASHMGFEPGGQVELSVPPAATPAELVARLRAEVTSLRGDCAREGVRLDAVATDTRTEAQVPLQLRQPRYLAMQQHFDAIGSAGRTMMRRTASTQVCLDWWPGPVGLEQWRLLHLAGPYLAAAFARTVGPGSRLATWLRVDPGRTAFDGRLLHGDDPVAAYADFADRAVPLTSSVDVAEHLTTLFPPVRPRGRYLEVRFLDVQPLHAVQEVVESLSTLLYDDRCRRAASRMVAADADDLGRLWEAAAAGDADLRERGRALVALGRGRARGLGGAA